MISAILKGLKGLTLIDWTAIVLGFALAASSFNNWQHRNTIADQKIDITSLNRQLGAEKASYMQLALYNSERNRAIGALQAAQELERSQYILGLQAANKLATGHHKAAEGLRAATSAATDKAGRCEDALQLIVDTVK